MDVVDGSTTDELMKRVREGEPLLRRLFSIYQEETPRLLADLERGMASRDEELVCDSIHQMKGSSAVMGATRIFALTEVALDLCKGGAVFELDGLVEAIRAEADLYVRELSVALDA